MFVACLYTEFHVTSFSAVLVVAVKPKLCIKRKVRVATTLSW
jgi:hypothetical protein